MKPRSLRVWLLGLATALMFAATTQAQSKSNPLARYVPRQDLIFFLEFDGFDAHNTAWSRSACYQFLNKTTMGALLEDVLKQGLDLALASAPKERKPTSTELIDAFKRLLRGGFVLGLSGKPAQGPPVRVFVARGAAKNGTRALIERLIAPPDAKVAGLQTETRAGRSIVKIETGAGGPAWWSENDDLVFVLEPGGIDAITKVIDGQAPNATNHPVRIELSKAEEGFETAVRAFIDFSAIPIPPDAAKATGVSGLKRIDYRWGFQDNALYSVTRLVAPAPRTGLLGLLDAPTFDKTTLPPLPPDLHGFTVLSAKPSEIYDRIVGVASAMDPKAGTEASKFLDQFRTQMGFDLKRDLMAHLGPKMTWGMKPATPRAPFDAFMTAQVDDPAGLAKVIDRLMPLVNAGLAGQRPGGARNAPGGAQMRKVTSGIGAGMTWIIDIPAAMLPPNLSGTGLKPTIRIGKSTLIIGSKPELAQSLIPLIEARGKRWGFTGDYAALARRLPGNLVMLSIEDPRDTLPPLIENLPALMQGINAAMAAQAPGSKGIPITINPSLVPRADAIASQLFPAFMAISTTKEGVSIVSRNAIPSMSSPASAAVAVALLLPAVQSAREAARRAQCVNNLKQIGLAIHNSEAVNNAFPAIAIADKAGKPLLSWRVAILPYIEQQELYNRFHLNEPWDSPHNKALIPLIPKTYQCPSRPVVEGQTHYRVFTGNGALLEMTKGTKISEITDGTSNTLMVVEAAEGVPWTKPEGIEFDPNSNVKLFGAGSAHPGGFDGLMADGSVRFFKAIINPLTLKALITKRGGEVLGNF